MRAAGPVHRLWSRAGVPAAARAAVRGRTVPPRRDRRVRWRPRAAATLAQRCHGRSGRRPLATRARRLSPILWRSPHIRGSERAVSAFVRPDLHYPPARIGRRASTAATATPERPCKRAERPRDAIADSRPVIHRCDRSSPSRYTIMYCPRMSDSSDRHFHVYCAVGAGAVRAFTSRSSDVFASREAAFKWARRQRPASRRIVRQCAGEDGCPGATLPPVRVPLPPPRPRQRRSARLLRVRRALDGLDATDLVAVESLIARLGGTT